MCQLFYFNLINGIDADEGPQILQTIDEIWVQVTCFVSPDSDSKVCSKT